MYREVLRNRAFLLYFSGTVTSGLGDVIAGMGFLFAVYEMTGSSLKTTGVAIAETIPYLLFGLIGGAVSDRIPRLKVMIYLDAARGVLQVVTFVLFITGHLPYALILVIVFAIQTAGCFFNPADRAMVPQLVPENRLTTANALVGMSFNSMPVLAPFVTAAMFATTGLGGFFILDALTYFVSFACLMRLSTYRPDLLARPADWSGEAEGDSPAGFRGIVRGLPRQVWSFALFTRTRSTLVLLFVTTFAVVFFNTWAWQVGLLLKAGDVSSDGKQLYATLMGIYAAFSILASLLIPRYFERLGVGHYVVGSFVWGTGVLAIAFAASPVTLAVCAAVVGLGLALGSQSRVFVLQTDVPEAMRGQGFAFAAVLLYLSNVVSLSLFGWLSERSSLWILFVAAGGGIVLVSAVAALWLASSRRPTPHAEPDPASGARTDAAAGAREQEAPTGGEGRRSL